MKIKIINTEPFRYIEGRLGKTNIFITKNSDNKIIISYGNFLTFKIKRNEILQLLKDTVNKQEKNKFLIYNYIKIMYWTSCIID